MDQSSCADSTLLELKGFVDPWHSARRSISIATGLHREVPTDRNLPDNDNRCQTRLANELLLTHINYIVLNLN